MKKIVLFLFGFTVWTAQSQIEIRVAGETDDVSGTTLTYNLDLNDVPAGSELFWTGAKFHVYNFTGSDQQFRLKRIRVDVPSDWKDDLCWPPQCYVNAQNNETGGYYITPAGVYIPTIYDGGSTTDQLGAVAEIKPQIYPETPGSSATYKYILTDATGTTDYNEVTIIVNYINNLNVSTIQKSVELTMTPNPASDFVTIQAEGITDGKIRVVDVLGNVVYTSDFNAAKKLSTSEFKNGVYFITIQSPSNKSMTKKLVVRH